MESNNLYSCTTSDSYKCTTSDSYNPCTTSDSYNSHTTSDSYNWSLAMHTHRNICAITTLSSYSQNQILNPTNQINHTDPVFWPHSLSFHHWSSWHWSTCQDYTHNWNQNTAPEIQEHHHSHTPEVHYIYKTLGLCMCVRACACACVCVCVCACAQVGCACLLMWTLFVATMAYSATFSRGLISLFEVFVG